MCDFVFGRNWHPQGPQWEMSWRVSPFPRDGSASCHPKDADTTSTPAATVNTERNRLSAGISHQDHMSHLLLPMENLPTSPALLELRQILCFVANSSYSEIYHYVAKIQLLISRFFYSIDCIWFLYTFPITTSSQYTYLPPCAPLHLYNILLP